jgi:hypothetical protein
MLGLRAWIRVTMSASLLRLHLWAEKIPEPMLGMVRLAQGSALICGKPAVRKCRATRLSSAQ